MSAQFIVGKFYMVPCMKVAEAARDTFVPGDGWLPVIGPKHRDAEFLDFDTEHYHIDWRFIPTRKYLAAVGRSTNKSAHGRVLTNDCGDRNRLYNEPVLKSRRMYREMPDFPAAPSGRTDSDGKRWIALESHQEQTCRHLKTGNICPHRGIDLTPFIKDDGTVICPGHGLKFDTRSGRLLPHHTRAA